MDANEQSNSMSQFQEILQSQIMDQELNKHNSDYQSFLDPFKEMGFNQEPQTQNEVNYSYNNMEQKLCWDESKIEIVSMKQKKSKDLTSNKINQELWLIMEKPIQDQQKMMAKLIKQNEEYHEFFVKLKQKLQQIVMTIHSKLVHSSKSMSYFTDFQQQCQMLQSMNMATFIQSTINKITQNSTQFNTLEQQILHLKVQAQILTNNNTKLLGHIEDRKKYSQSLKERISIRKQENQSFKKQIQNLKNQLNQAKNRENRLKQVIQELQKVQESLDLKFRTRNDLIMMVKSLSTKIMKHKKMCASWSQEVQDLPKFLVSSLALKKKVSNPEGYESTRI